MSPHPVAGAHNEQARDWARFTVRGQQFTKSAMVAAQDERGIIDVELEGEPLLLPPEEAAKWKAYYGPWTEFMEREFRANRLS